MKSLSAFLFFVFILGIANCSQLDTDFKRFFDQITTMACNAPVMEGQFNYSIYIRNNASRIYSQTWPINFSINDFDTPNLVGTESSMRNRILDIYITRFYSRWKFIFSRSGRIAPSQPSASCPADMKWVIIGGVAGGIAILCCIFFGMLKRRRAAASTKITAITTTASPTSYAFAHPAIPQQSTATAATTTTTTYMAQSTAAPHPPPPVYSSPPYAHQPPHQPPCYNPGFKA